MAYAKISRDSEYTTATSKYIYYTLYNGTSQRVEVEHVDLAEMLMSDLHDLFLAVGINSVVDTENNKITLDDGNEFYVSVYKTGGSYVPRLYQDGDYSSSSYIGGVGTECKMYGNGRFKYELYIYTTSDNNGISIEISDFNLTTRLALTNFIKISHPTNPNKKALFVTPYFPVSQGSTTSDTNMIKDLSDLSNCIMPTLASNTSVFKTMNAVNLIGTIFPDIAELNNFTLKNLVWYDLLELPEYYQMSTAIGHGTDFDDGTYKYHVLRYYQKDANNTIRVAIRYGTVA